MNKLNKILSVLAFTITLTGILYLSVFVSKHNKNVVVTNVSISGNSLLPEIDYKRFAHLDKISKSDSLSVVIIKDRLLKHPYLKSVDISFNKKGKATAVLKEKKFKALLLKDGVGYFVSEEYQLIPILQNTNNFELPVLTNCSLPENTNVLNRVNGKDVQTGFKLIDIAETIDKDFAKSITEINMNNGGEIEINLSSIKTPILLGNGEEIKKMIYLKAIIDYSVNIKSLFFDSNYIDLRFNNRIFVGKTENRV